MFSSRVWLNLSPGLFAFANLLFFIATNLHAFDKELPVLVALLAVALQHLGALEPLVFGLDFEQFRSHFHLSGFF